MRYSHSHTFVAPLRVLRVFRPLFVFCMCSACTLASAVAVQHQRLQPDDELFRHAVVRKHCDGVSAGRCRRLVVLVVVVAQRWRRRRRCWVVEFGRCRITIVGPTTLTIAAGECCEQTEHMHTKVLRAFNASPLLLADAITANAFTCVQWIRSTFNQSSTPPSQQALRDTN